MPVEVNTYIIPLQSIPCRDRVIAMEFCPASFGRAPFKFILVSLQHTQRNISATPGDQCTAVNLTVNPLIFHGTQIELDKFRSLQISIGRSYVILSLTSNASLGNMPECIEAEEMPLNCSGKPACHDLLRFTSRYFTIADWLRIATENLYCEIYTVIPCKYNGTGCYTYTVQFQWNFFGFTAVGC